MGLTKQAKTLSKRQVAVALSYLNETRYPLRNRVILLLSVKAGLRAKEIAGLTWEMLTDLEGNLGDAIQLRNSASKGRNGGRVVPLNTELKKALVALHERRGTSAYVIKSERNERTSPAVIVNLFAGWYRTPHRLARGISGRR
jgi:integrase/recombinase XerD